MRKVIQTSAGLSEAAGLSDWRQHAYNVRCVKKAFRRTQQVKRSRAKDEAKRAAREGEIRQAHEDYLALAESFLARVLGGRMLTYLGEISYSTYLGHFFLFILFKLAFVDDDLQLGGGQLAGFVALVAAVSVALYHGVEKPAQKWLNRRPPRWASRPAAIPAE